MSPTQCGTTREPVTKGGWIALAIAVLAIGGAGGLAACASEEAVGHSESTTRTVVDTPEQKSTVTETHTKDTRFYPR